MCYTFCIRLHLMSQGYRNIKEPFWNDRLFLSYIFFCFVVNLTKHKTTGIRISRMDIPLPRFLLRFLSHLRQVFDIPSWLRIANRYPTIELQKNQILSIRWQTLRTLHFQANTHFSMLRLFAKIKNRLQLGLLNKFSHKYT